MRNKIIIGLEELIYTKIFRNIFYLSRIGRRSMFGYADSGLNFDYIYRNSPSGYTKLGRLIDRVLLNLPAAKATRARKDRIVRILKEEIENNRKKEKITKIVDLASGPARYIVEVINEENKMWVEALCFDIDRRSLKFGRKLAGGKPILYKRANVCKLSHYKRLSRRKKWEPNVVLASGLYEYLNDAQAKLLLREIFNNIEESGLVLIVTQRDNPNRKLLEKLGRIKSGKEWKLFYRDPWIIEHWMQEVGFREQSSSIDRWGMYIFCRSRK